MLGAVELLGDIIMGLKDIGRKIGDIAFKLAISSCSCGWECGRCQACGNHGNLHTTEPSNEKKDHKSKEVVT